VIKTGAVRTIQESGYLESWQEGKNKNNKILSQKFRKHGSLGPYPEHTSFLTLIVLQTFAVSQFGKIDPEVEL
jgi:hypothetical protein